MKFIRTLTRRVFLASVILLVLGVGAVAATYFYLSPQLPSVEVLRDVHFQVPLQVYTQDQQLIAEYGSKKRDPVKYAEIPDTMIKAILAAEDDRFFHHPGVDYQGILRAALNLIMTGEKAQGGSTITMQVARNFFLSSEKTYLRKINEIFLSFKIEKKLSKEEILELYLNKIYLGNRAYGIGSAAKTYYGAPLDELTLAQYAMIAGLPKAPSSFNPIANPERAVIRRDYVLKRMRGLGYISEAEFQAARSEPVSARLSRRSIDLDAPFIGEMVRSFMYERYGEDAYTSGFKVYVTIDPERQLAAQEALRQALLSYEHRHGFRGPVEQIDVGPGSDFENILARLDALPVVGDLRPAVVLYTEDQRAQGLLANGDQFELGWEGLSWAAPYLNTNRIGSAPESAQDILTAGDVVYIKQQTAGTWQLGQIPHVSGAIVALDPEDGAIVALSGGYDFFHSKFNRVTQAKRQPGSSFKPFIYSSALEKGFTPASIINDAPVVFDDPGLETSWRPENYSGRIYGPTRLREALTRSRNLVSIRLLQSIGIPYAIRYVQRFGFDPERLPRDLSLSLGSAAVTPLEMATGYAVFANGGFRVTPYFIQRIEDMDGNTVFEADPAIACLPCEEAEKEARLAAAAEADPPPDTEISAQALTAMTTIEEPDEPNLAERVITAQNAYLMTDMMQDVVRRGTARRALQLGRKDIAGKTGTTNDQRDAWFAGFNHELVAISWVGFDDGGPLGNRETGGHAALPMWIEFMRSALADMPETELEQPQGLVTVRIDPQTGLLAPPSQRNAVFEIFRHEHVPQRQAPDIDESVASPDSERGDESSPQLLF
ncbi:peptidase [Candidatus Tenderia electrophaga]|jgi:penicillin-binding protein 1A|uniref:Penicillin-binding protein 1A n=1 Tax=Candidatus Tenderia electrophaga TaxID=1748243 RepID=A0A0S2TGF0_9GAMM|nr:peptidase [Candidatus Tenderia electrophaga]